MSEPGESIELPSLLLLSEAGREFCAARGIILRDIRTRSGERAEGFAWSSFRAEAISRLVSHGFLSALEVSRPEMVSARPQILALVRAVVASVLERRIRAELRRGRRPGCAIASNERYASYSRRKGIAEHLAILSMEFVQAAEKCYLKHLASRDPRARNARDRIDALLAQASFRERLITHAAQRGELLVFRVEIEAGAVRVGIRNRGLIDSGGAEEFDARNAESIYHARLADECAFEGIGFGSTVSRDRGRGETRSVISLSFDRNEHEGHVVLLRRAAAEAI